MKRVRGNKKEIVLRFGSFGGIKGLVIKGIKESELER